MTLHIIMLAALIIGGLACAWWLHRAYQERRKRQIYAAARIAAGRKLAEELKRERHDPRIIDFTGGEMLPINEETT